MTNVHRRSCQTGNHFSTTYRGKHVQNCLKQLGLWARTDQHITNHWIIIFLDIQSYLEVWCFMYAFGVHTFLGGVCACFFFELNSKKTCPNLAWLCFFLRFLFTQKWSCNPRPTFEFTQSHPRPDRPTYSKYSKTPCHFFAAWKGKKSQVLGTYQRSIQTGRKCWNAAKAAGNYKRNPESHPTNGDGSISDSCKWFTPT